MKTLRNIAYKGNSDYVNMGGNLIRQPLPTQEIDKVDPFLLLHHYKYEVSPYSPGLSLSPHPHRGFEPVTFLFKGEQLHRDSLGNEGILEAGDVQWMTAGSGIIHDEGPSKNFTGTMEGIQLWVNLPKKHKMTTPKYQDIKAEQMPIISVENGKGSIKVVAGALNGHKGPVSTFTEINAFIANLEASGNITIPIPATHELLVYLLEGEAKVNNSETLEHGKLQMLTFKKDGEAITLEATKNSTILILSGEPIKEKIKSWGPYVMNSQTEIMEALRDYQDGKMGHLY
ncbi:Putative quercetin 2,3-dioxygenase [Kordia antarctica]|uniref:Quercetin 2,3-dioxygenase n=1 Tax=Kordia antarctica TaxID=1218801 RepID=A0A7L4ZRL2_9FLAO|nr:pirin family protein [Kordia antarctica]QHI38846.1 Putative quercetin 2,3-dioxygenase [Kordia antarctica]